MIINCCRRQVAQVIAFQEQTRVRLGRVQAHNGRPTITIQSRDCVGSTSVMDKCKQRAVSVRFQFQLQLGNFSF